MPLLMYATLILSTLATCNACSCQPGHPQENFCDAHFGEFIHYQVLMLITFQQMVIFAASYQN